MRSALCKIDGCANRTNSPYHYIMKALRDTGRKPPGAGCARSTVALFSKPYDSSLFTRQSSVTTDRFECNPQQRHPFSTRGVFVTQNGCFLWRPLALRPAHPPDEPAITPPNVFSLGDLRTSCFEISPVLRCAFSVLTAAWKPSPAVLHCEAARRDVHTVGWGLYFDIVRVILLSGPGRAGIRAGAGS